MASSSNRSSPSRDRKDSTSKAHRRQPSKRGSGSVRIIAGQLRGRKLPIPDVVDLRPSPDRLRETLFNWLQHELPGSLCLDLFAGTGSLGWEAVSRYAKDVAMVEPDPEACSALHKSVDALGMDNVNIHQVTAAEFLKRNTQVFDIVFIDPPFKMQCQWAVLQELVEGHLNTTSSVYIESPNKQGIPATWPEGISLHREKRFGDVIARLFHYRQ